MAVMAAKTPTPITIHQTCCVNRLFWGAWRVALYRFTSATAAIARMIAKKIQSKCVLNRLQATLLMIDARWSWPTCARRHPRRDPRAVRGRLLHDGALLLTRGRHDLGRLHRLEEAAHDLHRHRRGDVAALAAVLD